MNPKPYSTQHGPAAQGPRSAALATQRDCAPGPTRARGERGVVLFVALIVLVVMALTGVAMIRQSGSGLSIAGNIGMRQNAVSGADLGTETALVWWTPLTKVNGALDANLVAQGYFSDWGTTDPRRLGGDPTRYDWSAGNVLVTADDGTGNEVRYIIERLCKNPGVSVKEPGQQCVQTVITDGGDKSGTCDNYPRSCPELPKVTHYRVSSRVVGPRNTFSYIQVIVTTAS